MNSLETEYSFLSPTWKLPSFGGTSSIYTPPKLSSDASNLSNTMYNSRYVPPNSTVRTRPQPTKQQSGGRSMQSGPLSPSQQTIGLSMKSGPLSPSQKSNDQYRSNQHSDDNLDLDDPNDIHHNGHSNKQNVNKKLHYSQPSQKRVQIIDHNRQTPSSTDYMSGKESHTSYTPDFNKSKLHNNKTDSSNGDTQRPKNFDIHDYLYSLATHDPGSYVNAYKNQQRRLQDEKTNRKAVLTEYKNFAQNCGFGPAFGNVDYKSFDEKLDTENKRKSYSKVVREINQYKIEGHKRMQNNNGQQRNGTVYTAPLPKLRHPDAKKAHFLSSQEDDEYEDYIRPWSRSETLSRLSIISPILSTPRRLSNSPALRQDSFDNLHPWNQNDILSGEFYVDRSSSPVSIPRRVRFHSRDFIRRRSSTFIDLPIEIIGTNIPLRTESALARFSRQKSTAKILEEKDQLAHHSSSSKSNIKEKKFITSHSMMNSNMQSSPTAMLKNIKQPYRSENRIMATTSTNNIKKPILVIKSPENSSKTTSRNVRFVPEIIADDEQVTNSQLPSSTTTEMKTNCQYKDPIPTNNSTDN